jgi:hypothetical protein
MDKRPMIYVAGPISKGAYWINVRNGVDMGHELMKRGYVPFVPMMDFLMVFAYPETQYEALLDYDFQVISRCDALLRIPGESAGADREIAFAHENNIPVFYTVDDLDNWKNTIYGKEESCCFDGSCRCS